MHLPGTILVAEGARREVGAQLQRHDARRVLLVTDTGVVRLGAAAEIADLIRAAGIAVSVFDQVQPDPTDRNVADGLVQLKAEHCEAIVALGGGSPIGAAKAISIASVNALPLSQYAGYHQMSPPRTAAHRDSHHGGHR